MYMVINISSTQEFYSSRKPFKNINTLYERKKQRIILKIILRIILQFILFYACISFKAVSFGHVSKYYYNKYTGK